MKLTQISPCVYTVNLPGHSAVSKDDSKTESRFLGEPENIVISAPLPGSWQSLCTPSPFVLSLKVYCGTTRVVNDSAGSSAVKVQNRTPPFHVNALLDIEADVRAMKQPGGGHVYVYGGFADHRQKLPPLYSCDAIRKFLSPLMRLNGRVFVPVVRRCVEGLGSDCQEGDPIAESLAHELEISSKAVTCPVKYSWLQYLHKECPGVASVAFAELATMGKDIDVILVPSMHYFISNMTGLSSGASVPRRCAQVKFTDFVGLADCAGASTVRVGSQNTVHVSYTGECSLIVASIGCPKSIVIDGKIQKLVFENLSKEKEHTPLQKVLHSLYQVEKIMASHLSVDKSQALRAAKMAAPHMKVYVETVVSGAFDKTTREGVLGTKVMDMLKTTLDHIFKPDAYTPPCLNNLMKPVSRMSSIF